MDRNAGTTPTHLLFAVSLSLSLIAGCLSGPVVVPSTAIVTPHAFVPSGETVLLLPPVVTYEKVREGTILDPPVDSPETIEYPLDSAVRRELARLGFKLADEKPTGTINALRGGGDRTRKAKQLMQLGSSSSKDAESKRMSLLESLVVSSEARLVGLVSVRVKVGRGGAFEPFFGIVWHNTHRADFSFSLLSPQTGAAVWRRQVLLRGWPSAGSAAECVDMAFAEMMTSKTETADAEHNDGDS